MRRSYFSLPASLLAAFIACLVLGIASLTNGQAGTRAQATADSGTPSSKQAETQSGAATGVDTGKYVLESQVPLVILDVVVTDGKGHPVHGLKASDFTVLEKGQSMTIQSFEEHRYDQAPPPAPQLTREALGPNFFTNITYTPNNGPLNVLLMDALNTPMADQIYVRQQMRDYLKKLPEGTRIAIFGLSTHLFMLQGFTTDPALLKAVLNRKKALPSNSPLLTTPEEVEEQQNQLDSVSAMGNDPSSGLIQSNMQQFMDEQETFQTTLRVQYTLAAMEVLGRYLAALPGRKNVIWFSGSFPINIMPDGDSASPFGAMADYADEVRATANLLARSQAAVYPVDARGLFVNPAVTASLSGASAARNPQGAHMANSKFLYQTALEHGSMDMMAEQSGGKAFYNINGLKEAVQEAVNQGSNYYTLTYTPTNRRWDGSYRSVRVNVNQSGVKLFYRRGYFAVNPNASAEHGEKALPYTAVQSAMLHGGPDPTQILFEVQVLPSPGRENLLSPGNFPNGNKLRPPYRHYSIFYVPDVRNLAITTAANGNYQGSLRFLALLYSPDGELINSNSTSVKLNLPPARYKLMMQRGLQVLQYIDAPAKGEYFLRIGVHDLTTDHVGAVEVPLTAIQPPPAPPGTAGK